MIKRLVFVAFVAFALVGVTACSNGNKKPEEPQPEELGVRKIFTITDRSEENDFAYTGVFKGAEQGKSLQLFLSQLAKAKVLSLRRSSVQLRTGL